VQVDAHRLSLPIDATPMDRIVGVPTPVEEDDRSRGVPPTDDVPY
jgi:hypothetical protein